MNYRFYFLPLLAIFCLSASSLIAQTADVQAGCTPLVVQFSAPADAGTFFWDFKDGSDSDLENPRHTFTEAGTYEVDFKTTSGGAVVGTIEVRVFDRPEINVAIDPEVGCAPATFTLTNTPEIPEGLDITGYSWDFGTETMSGKSIEVNYAEPGLYSFNLIISSSFPNCNSAQDFTDALEVKSPPATNFSISPQTLFCQAPATITLINSTPGANLSYAWNLGNGATSSEESPGSLTFTENGDYDIALTATDSDGCSRTVTKRVSVGPPAADFTVSANDTVCTGSAVSIQNLSSAGNYSWTITNGPINFTSTDANPEYDFPVPGNYTVTLSLSDPTGTCSATETKTVHSQRIDATFSADPTYGCSEPYTVAFTPDNPVEGAMYNWDFGDDSTSTETAPIHDFYADNESPYHQNGEFLYTTKLLVTTTAGCSDEYEVTDTLDIPLARFMPDTISGCAPLEVEFSDSSFSTTPIINWEYIYGDGNMANFSNDDPHTYTFAQAGEYDVQLVITNELDCPDTSYVIRVEVGERITPDFTTDKTSVCQGEMIQFTDVTGNPNIDEWHYYTDDDRSSHCFDDANPTIPFESATGKFEVNMVVGYNGCLDSLKRTDFIEVKGPLAKLEYRMICDTPNTVVFTSASEEVSTLNWDFGDTQLGTMETEAHKYAQTGDYKVVLTVENPATGCPASVDSAIVAVRNIKADGPVELEQCKNQPIMLNSESSVDVDTSCFRGYTWFFNHPGVRPVTTNQPTVDDVSYPDTGMYQIDLVVEDVNGCTDTASYPVIVHEPMVAFELDKDRICPGQSVGIINISASTTAERVETFMWDFGDGVGMSEEQNPGSYTYGPQVGGDRVTISVMVEDDAGCPGSAEQTVELYRITSAIRGDVTVCVGEPVSLEAINTQNLDVTYSWDLGNGENAEGESVSALYGDGAIYNVNLRMEEAGTGCVGNAMTMVNVQDFPIADFNVQEPLCAPSAISFTNASQGMIESVNWTFTIGGTSSNSADVNPVRNFLTAGNADVSLEVKTSNGCASDIIKTITVEPLPSGDFTIDDNRYCAGDALTVTLTSTAEVESFSWAYQDMPFGDNENTSSFTIPEGTNNNNARVELVLTGRGGCSDVVTKTVAVSSSRPSFSTDIDPCFSRITLTNTSTGLTNILWNSGENNTTSSDPDSVSFDYTGEGTYTVSLTGTDALGCEGTTSQSVSIMKNTLTDDIIPNAFTPETTGSGTGINDIFRVKNVDEATGLCSPVKRVINFVIYNRWGVQVYSANNIPIDQGWDGTYKGKIQPAGVYLYAIEVEYEDDSSELLKGDVTLIR